MQHAEEIGNFIILILFFTKFYSLLVLFHETENYGKYKRPCENGFSKLNPVKIFNNAIEDKQDIYKYCKGKRGIYL